MVASGILLKSTPGKFKLLKSSYLLRPLPRGSLGSLGSRGSLESLGSRDSLGSLNSRDSRGAWSVPLEFPLPGRRSKGCW